MKRDGATTSLWQYNQPDYSATNQHTADKTYDVVIAGGGITGITVGLLLQKAGRSCLVAEAHNLCFGTTGGTTAHLNTFLDASYDQIRSDFGEHNAQLVAQATRQALDLFKQHVKEYNIDCGYEEKDGFVYAQDGTQTEQLDKMFEAAEQAGVAVAYTDQIPVPIEFEKAIVYSGQAQIHPARYVYALAKAFEEAGGVIWQQCLVKNVEGKEVLDIETSRGRLKAKNLIYATHIPPGVNLLHFRCAPYRSYAMAVTLKDGNYPDGLAYDMHDPYHYYRTMEADGARYLVAGGEDHKTAHGSNTDACFLRLESYLRKYYDIDQVAFKWSSQYFAPSDGLAYIGHLPGNPDNIFVATGYGGNGITYSHIAALTLSGLIVNGSSPYADLFSPGRVKPVAGFSHFVKEAADVVVQFFGKRFGQGSIQEIADLANGEARVVKYEGDSIALYKDDNGRLYAVNPVCPHAKCLVGWNSAEKSWDCPCHGSRFSPEGELLTGPARRGLEKMDISEHTPSP